MLLLVLEHLTSPSTQMHFFLCSLLISTEMMDDNTVYDLFELANVHKKHHGVSLVKGPDANSPAYKILNPNLIPSVPELSFRDLLFSIHSERGFIFSANLKQAKRTRGTLISVEKTDGSGSLFEIISNGKANTVDVVYASASGQHVVSIEDVDVANGHWKNITVFVQEDRAQVHVGCEEINIQELDVPIQQILNQEVADISNLRIGKGAAKTDRFMVRNLILGLMCRRVGDKSFIYVLRIVICSVWERVKTHRMRTDGFDLDSLPARCNSRCWKIVFIFWKPIWIIFFHDSREFSRT